MSEKCKKTPIIWKKHRKSRKMRTFGSFFSRGFLSQVARCSIGYAGGTISTTEVREEDDREGEREGQLREERELCIVERDWGVGD